jgi:hypothetical protein
MVYACRVTQVGNCGKSISYTSGNGPYIAGRGWWQKNTHATYRKAMADARRQIAEWEWEQNRLWCIHIPGPCEVHAAPSKDAAEHMAKKHNEAMAAYFAKNPPSQFTPSIECTQASVIEWPHSPEEHAHALTGFDAAGWGMEVGA